MQPKTSNSNKVALISLRSRITTMALSKTSLVLCLSMIVFIALVAEVADAKFISYGALNSNGRICRNPAGCHQPEIPANPYNRGCEVSQRCRGGSDQPKDDPKES